MRKPKAILFDLDGVLYTGNLLIDGARGTIETLKSSGLDCRFVTNTSTLSIRSLHQKLVALGLPVEAHEIISAPHAALLYLKKQTNPLCRLLLADDVKQDFAVLSQSELHPNFIVIGDIGDAWSYSLLNELFLNLMQGAKLIAIHKNRFWQTETGLNMDIGAFVHGLEYASRTEAMIIGKPAKAFFEMALETLSHNREEVIMVGDDIDSDIGGALSVGIRGVLVKTGKYRQVYTESSSIKPTVIIDSVADLSDWLASPASGT